VLTWLQHAHNLTDNITADHDVPMMHYKIDEALSQPVDLSHSSPVKTGVCLELDTLMRA
jgi:hypothetical protein